MTERQASNGPVHVVAVVGGAVAGAEVAGRLADRGVQVVVFEMNPRPYGKIEDGLPRWHGALRRKEYGSIGERLSKPGVHFVPSTKIGIDVDFEDLVHGWGFSAVVLANGAWRDRLLPVPDAEQFVGKGLVYQNQFIFWFNHNEEAGYDGPRFDPVDDVLVVGGGLASIDVVKALMLETTRAKLRDRGISADTVELEVKGIPRFLAAHGLEFEDLGLVGCTLFYRRRALDMPLVEIPDDATPKRREKALNARGKLLDKAMTKYRFRFEPLSAPEALLVENDRVVGLRFRRTRIENGRVTLTDERFERRGAWVISSIGSIPEAIPGVAMKGELFDFKDWDLGRLEGYPSLVSVGNVVTGKGNIVASRKHASAVSEVVIERYLGLCEDGHEGEEALLPESDGAATDAARSVAERLEQIPPLAPEAAASLLDRVRKRQGEVGYGGDYGAWIAKVSPPDLA